MSAKEEEITQEGKPVHGMCPDESDRQKGPLSRGDNDRFKGKGPHNDRREVKNRLREARRAESQFDRYTTLTRGLEEIQNKGIVT
ncbi:hypothetical protein ACOSP7_014353 [Xanthoceras sorbifolium]